MLLTQNPLWSVFPSEQSQKAMATNLKQKELLVEHPKGSFFD